jgi:hypothetical protein
MDEPCKIFDDPRPIRAIGMMAKTLADIAQRRLDMVARR